MSDGFRDLEALLARELGAPVHTSPARKARIMAMVRASSAARVRRARTTGRQGYLRSSLGLSLAAVLAGVLIAGIAASPRAGEGRAGVMAGALGDSITAALHDTAQRVGIVVVDTQGLVDSASRRVADGDPRSSRAVAVSRAVSR